MIKPCRILSILFLVVGLANLIRAGMAVYIAPALDGRALSLPLPLLGGFYLLCGLYFLATGLIYWWKKHQRYAVALALAYQSVFWILRLAADRSDYARSLWPRDALLTIAFIALVTILSHNTNFELRNLSLSQGITIHDSRITHQEKK